MNGPQAIGRQAILAVILFCVLLSGCRDSGSKVKMTRSDGTTQYVSGGEALLCFFSLGLACPRRAAGARDDVPLADTPPVPGGISVVAASDGISEIHLSWRPASDERVGRYRIYRDGNLIADSAEPAYTDSLLDANRSYCYRVAAIDESLNQSAPSAQACATTGWQIAAVESNVRDVRPAIAVDDLGQPHLAYAGLGTAESREISYANRLSGAWRSETVGFENEVFTDAPAIVIDAAGAVHIGTLEKYSSNVFGDWRAERFEAHDFSTMALDSSGFVHLVSGDPKGDLNHTTNSGGVWTSQAIGGGSWQQAALVIDDRDVLHIVYYDYAERALVYAGSAGGSLVSEVIARQFPPIWHLDLAVDAGRRLHFSYQSKPAGDSGALLAPAAGDGLGYASNIGGSWQFSRIDSGDGVGAGSSIAVDSQGRVHISYTASRQNELRYASNVSGDWKVLTLDRGNAVDGECQLPEELCWTTAIALDREDKAHIAYHDRERILYVSNR